MEIGVYTPEQALEVLEAIRTLKGSPLLTERGLSDGNYSLEREVHLVKNESTDAVIPFGIMQVTGTENIYDRTYMLVDKPADVDGTAGQYLFNGPSEIGADGGLGNGFDGPLIRVATDETTINAGDKFQPIVSDWKVEAGGDLITAAGQDHIRSEGVMKGFIGSTGGAGVTTHLLKTPIGGIAARSSTTAGKADCTPYYIDSTTDTITELLDASNNSQTITIYNVSASPVAELTYIQAKKVRGVFIVDMEDCG